MGWSQGLGRRTYGCTGCSCDGLRQISARCISPEEAKAVHNVSGVVVRQDVPQLDRHWRLAKLQYNCCDESCIVVDQYCAHAGRPSKAMMSSLQRPTTALLRRLSFQQSCSHAGCVPLHQENNQRFGKHCGCSYIYGSGFHHRYWTNRAA